MPSLVLLLHREAATRRDLRRQLEARGHAVIEAEATRPGMPTVDVVVTGPGCIATGQAAAVMGLDAVPELQGAPSRALLPLAACAVDLAGALVVRDGAVEELTDKETALLAHLVAHGGTTVERGTLLREVWGYQETTQTRTIDNTVRRLRAKIEADPSNPVHVLTVRGEGYRFEGPGRAEAPSSLLGRAAELAELQAMADASRGLITILGSAGMGKTTLARAWSELQPRHAFVELASARSAADVEAAVANVLGSGNGALGPWLAEWDGWLVLDNLEQLDSEAIAAIDGWWASAPELRALATSRRRLGLDRERVVELGPLDTGAGRALLLRAARERRPTFATGAADEDHVTSLVTLLRGVPLALELAAARARVLSARDLCDRLRRDPGILRADQDVEPRHATLRAALQWSWDLLDEAERHGLFCVAQLPASFALDLAEAATGDDALDAIEALIDHSLVQVAEPVAGQLRFSVLVPVRHFAAEKFGDAAAYQVRFRVAEWLVEETRRRNERFRTPEALETLALLDAEREVAEVAAYTVAPRDPHLAARLLTAYQPWCSARLTPTRMLAALDALAPRVGDDIELLSAVHFAIGTAKLKTGSPEEAATNQRELNAIAQAHSEPVHTKRALLVQTFACLRSGELDTAAKVAQALAESQPVDDFNVDAMHLWMSALTRRGEGAASRGLGERAIALAKSLGMVWHASMLEGFLGAALFGAWEFDEAIVRSERALVAHRASQNLGGMADMLANIGMALVMSGRAEQARPYLREARDVLDDYPNPSSRARLRYILARQHKALGELEQALEMAREALAIDRRHGFGVENLWASLLVGQLLNDLGRSDEAIEVLTECRGLVDRIGVVDALTWWALARATADVHRGELQSAEDVLTDALERSREARGHLWAHLIWVRAIRGDRSGARQALAAGLDEPDEGGPPTPRLELGLTACLFADGDELAEAAEQDAREWVTEQAEPSYVALLDRWRELRAGRELPTGSPRATFRLLGRALASWSTA